MIRITLTTLFFFALVASAPAQDHGYSRYERMMATVEARFQRLEHERQQAAVLSEHEFRRRAERFVRRWNEFVEAYNQGIVDVRQAAEVSRAFRRLESAAQWPAKPSKSRAQTSSVAAK